MVAPRSDGTEPPKNGERSASESISLQERRSQDFQNHAFFRHIAELRRDLVPFLTEVCKGPENGLHALAVMTSNGDLLIEDEADKWEVKNRRDAFEVVESFLRTFLSDYHKMLPPESIAHLDDELITLFDPRQIRLTVGDHYIAAAHIDRDAHIFLVAVCWKKRGYTALTFGGPVNSGRSCRDKIIDFLQANHSEWYRSP